MLRPQDILYGINVNEIARLCKVDVTTARRWKRGAKCPPQSALMILSGDLGHLDPAWAGWRLSRGQLISPEGWEALPGHVRAMKMMHATLGIYRRENQHLKAEVQQLVAERDAFEDQPAPASWEIASK